MRGMDEVMEKIDQEYLVDLWHMSRSAGVSGPHNRRVWCAATYEKQRPGFTSKGVYKAMERLRIGELLGTPL